MKPLPVVSLNQEACQACYENSDSLAAQKNLIEVPIGGNVALFKNPSGVCCEELTIANYRFEDAATFVALQLILDWSESKPTGCSKSPILDRSLQSVGISLKQTKNWGSILQILYVKGI